MACGTKEILALFLVNRWDGGVAWMATLKGGGKGAPLVTDNVARLFQDYLSVSL